jgi:hypothetical protein
MEHRNMEVLPWPSIAWYSSFGILVYYQRLYAQACTGHDRQKLLLTGLAFAGMLTGFIYLVYFGWKTAWWMAAIPLAMSALATIPAILLERMVGRTALGQFAVLAWPLCAYLMFDTLRS